MLDELSRSLSIVLVAVSETSIGKIKAIVSDVRKRLNVIREVQPIRSC